MTGALVSKVNCACGGGGLHVASGDWFAFRAIPEKSYGVSQAGSILKFEWGGKCISIWGEGGYKEFQYGGEGCQLVGISIGGGWGSDIILIGTGGE